MTKWTKESTINLIADIEKNNFWNVKEPTRRHEMLKDIAMKYSCTTKEIEDKWHSLRSQYSREETKIRKRKLTGSNKPLCSLWYAFDHLGFLKTPQRPLPMVKNDPVPQQNDVPVETPVSNFQILHMEPDEEINNEYSIQIVNNTPEQVTPQRIKRQRLTSEEEIDIMESIRMISNKLTQMENKDPCDVFTDYVANELRRYRNERYRHILVDLKRKINDALYEAELEKLKADKALTESTLIRPSDVNASTHKI